MKKIVWFGILVLFTLINATIAIYCQREVGKIRDINFELLKVNRQVIHDNDVLRSRCDSLTRICNLSNLNAAK